MFVKSFKVHWTLSLHKSETNFLFDLFSYYKNFFDCRTVRFFFESLFQKAIWILDGLFFFFSFFFFISSKFLYLLFDDLNLFLNQRRIFFLEKLASFPLFEGFFIPKTFLFFLFLEEKISFWYHFWQLFLLCITKGFLPTTTFHFGMFPAADAK